MDLDAQLINDELLSFASLLLDENHPIQQRLQLESLVGGLHKATSFSSSSSLSSSSQSPNDLLVQNFPRIDDHNHQTLQTPINDFLGYRNNPNTFSIEGFSSSSTSSQNKQNSYFPVFPTPSPSFCTDPIRDLASGFSPSTNNYHFHDHHHGKFIQTHNIEINENDGLSKQNNLPFPIPSLKRIDEDGRPSSSAKSPKKSLVKGPWTAEEDKMLVQLVGERGDKYWTKIARSLGGRIGKQCRERWHNHLKPDIKNDAWSTEEDEMLIQAHKEIGNKWAQIAKRLPGRTENSIKNHWNTTKRRQLVSTRRNYRSPEPSSSVAALKDYIHAVTSSSSASWNETTQSPPLSNWVKNDNFVMGSSSVKASNAPATNVMYDLKKALEQPLFYRGDIDSGFEGIGFESTMEIPGFSFADFSDTNFFGMSIDSYSGEVDGSAMVRSGDGGEETEVTGKEEMGLLDILISQC